MWREDKCALRPVEPDWEYGVIFIGRKLQCGARHCARDGQGSGIAGRGRGGNLFADVGVDAVGSKSRLGVAEVPSVKANEDFGWGFGEDVRELLAVGDGDVAFFHPGTKLREQDLTVDAEGFVAVSLLIAQGIEIGGFLVLILEGSIGEVVACAANPCVDPQGIENAKGIGGEHECARASDCWLPKFVNGTWYGSLMKSER